MHGWSPHRGEPRPVRPLTTPTRQPLAEAGPRPPRWYGYARASGLPGPVLFGPHLTVEAPRHPSPRAAVDPRRALRGLHGLREHPDQRALVPHGRRRLGLQHHPGCADPAVHRLRWPDRAGRCGHPDARGAPPSTVPARPQPAEVAPPVPSVPEALPGLADRRDRALPRDPGRQPRRPALADLPDVAPRGLVPHHRPAVPPRRVVLRVGAAVPPGRGHLPQLDRGHLPRGHADRRLPLRRAADPGQGSQDDPRAQGTGVGAAGRSTCCSRPRRTGWGATP